MKKVLLCIVPLFALLLSNAQGAGVMSFPVGPLSFSAVDDPNVLNGWSTINITGAGNTWTTANGALDPAAQAQTASGITGVLARSATLPPSTSGAGFRYNTNASNPFLQSRPTGDAGVMLLGSFQNDSGQPRTAVNMSYIYGISNVLAGELPGWQVYYSFTGAANSWTLIPAFSGGLPAGVVSNTITLSAAWGVGQPLYILWVDDNADGVTDESYTMDDFRLETGECVPPGITTQPHAVTVETCRATNLTVTAVGSSLTYQWYHDNNPIGGATASVYSIPSAQAPDSGTYFVRVSGACGSPVDSSAVTVTVNQDNDSPNVVSAHVHCDATTLVVSFNELMEVSSSQEAGSYTLVPLDGGTQRGGTGTAVLTNGTNVIVTLDGPISASKNYELQITPNVSDCSGNPLAPTGAGGVVHVAPLIEVCMISMVGQAWKYNTNATDLGVDWRSDPGFDEAANGFVDGTSVFDVKTGTDAGRTTIGGFAVQTMLPITSPNWAGGVDDIPVYYFRTHFTMPSAQYSSLILSALVDDHDVFWLNNQPTPIHFRNNPVFSATNSLGQTNFDAFNYSRTTVGNAALTLPDSVIDLTSKIGSFNMGGDNLAAVKLFQGNTTSSDATFAYELKGVVSRFGPALTITYSGGQVHVTWTPDASMHLYRSTTADGSSGWTSVALGSAGSFNETPSGARFYTLRKP